MARKPLHEQGDTLKTIKAAAFRLFGRYGYDGVSMGKIAKEASITKAAIYWHFDDKKALYITCMEHLFEVFKVHVFGKVVLADSPSQKILYLFEGTLGWLCDEQMRQGVAGYWLEGSGEQLEEAKSIQDRFQSEARIQLALILAQGMESGEFEVTVSAQSMAEAIITLILAGVMPLKDQTTPQTQALMQTLAHTFFCAYGKDSTYAERALLLGRAV